MIEPNEKAEPSGASGGSLAWIPVTERLPEEGERVLFYNGNCKEAYARNPHIGVCIDDGPTGTKELRIVDLLLRQVTPNRDETWPDVEATHWMPLPAPPAAANKGGGNHERYE